MNLDLESEWHNLAKKFTKKDVILENTYQNLFKSYSSKNRHYHNLTHIEAMLLAVNQYKNDLKDIDSFKFAVWFHDIIYTIASSKNEIQSAKLAVKILTEFEGITEFQIQKIKQFITDTQEHKPSSQDNDLLFFLDIDMQILGQDLESYKQYSQNIRKEYQIIPSFLYKKGRKKVLEQFLERERIYFTDIFHQKFEQKARQNIAWEIKSLC